MHAIKSQIPKLRVLHLELALLSHTEPAARSLCFCAVDLLPGLVTYDPRLIDIQELLVPILSIFLVRLQMVVDEEQALARQLHRDINSALISYLVHET